MFVYQSQQPRTQLNQLLCVVNICWEYVMVKYSSLQAIVDSGSQVIFYILWFGQVALPVIKYAT